MFIEMGSHDVTQTGFELTAPLLQPLSAGIVDGIAVPSKNKVLLLLETEGSTLSWATFLLLLHFLGYCLACLQRTDPHSEPGQ